MDTITSVQSLINKSEQLNEEFMEEHHRLEETLLDIRMAYNKPVSSETPFVISFVGRFKTGKSSLVNALIGADILPTKATTATSVVTRIFYGASAKCWLSDGNEDKEITIEEGKEIILNYKVTDVERPVEVIFELPIPWLKDNIELRDTPGMDDSSQDGNLEKIALNALNDTDLCICVYDASTMISEKERTRTQKIHSTMSGNVVYVVNCTNRLNSIESVHQVENLANNFFGSMDYSIPDMGKYYMVCSAPKMIELDGFDQWLKKFVYKNNLTMLNEVRKNTGVGQINTCRKDFVAKAEWYSERIEQQIEFLKNKHEEIIRKKQQENIRIVQAEVKEFDKKVIDMANELSNTSSNLREKIQICKNDGTDYESKTKTETQNYFIESYKAKIGNYGNYFEKNDVGFLKQAFNGITFPGVHTKAVAATTGEKSGWAIAGGIIGSIIAPGIGTAIGTAIGAAIGSADTTVDDSVYNTMSFIESSVVPLIKTAINEKISATRKKIKDKKNQACNSGLEDLIAQTESVQKMINVYITKN